MSLFKDAYYASKDELEKYSKAEEREALVKDLASKFGNPFSDVDLNPGLVLGPGVHLWKPIFRILT